MVLAKGDFVKINYTGKIKENGRIFDTTIESVAKKEDIYRKDVQFKAAPIVIGAGHVLKGLDKALVGMEVGEKKTIELEPENAYGKRNPKLVKVVSARDFKKQGLKPVLGMRIEADGRVGKIQSVSGGRVRVDFNYELAGKVVTYEVTVEEKVNKLEEKIRLLLERHFPYADSNDHEIEVRNGKAVITLSNTINLKDRAISREYLAKDILALLKLNEVEFRESFKK